MKRSWATMARVLETAEALDLDETSEHWVKQDKSFIYHARLLCTEGYLCCDQSDEGSSIVTIRRMTMKGHDLLDRLRQCKPGESPLS